MQRRDLARLALVGSFAALGTFGSATAQEATPVDQELTPVATPAASGPPPPVRATVLATGLDNPRGLAFGPDGALFVAEAGSAGDGPCIEGPEGNRECYGNTGAITRIEAGSQQRVVEGLRSRAAEDGSQATGPHDVALDGGDLYAVVGLAGAPATRAELDDDGGELGRLIEVADGNAELVADIVGFEGEANPDGNEVNSNPYSLAALDEGGFVVADAGANALLRVDTDGEFETLAVFPDRPETGPNGQELNMHAVPNSVAIGPDGDYYVGQLTGFPFPAGGANVYRVPAGGGEPEVFASGFTNIIDVAFGPDGSLYVLELFRGGLPNVNPEDPSTLKGRLVRVAPDGSQTEVAGSGLIAPGSVVLDDDGALYLSIYSVLPGAGQVIRFDPAVAEAGTPIAATPVAATTSRA